LERGLISILVLLSVLAFVAGCKEVGPDINLHGNPNVVSDTTYIESPVATPEAKNVVIEDFTGVNCPNCPAGHAIIAALETQYPGKIVPVAYHPSNILGRPFSYSAQDLENQGSTNLLTYLQDQGQEPEGAVDREVFPCGGGPILMDYTCWTGAVGQEIGLTPLVNVLLSCSYSTSTRSAQIIVELHYTQNVSHTNNLTIELTEDSVVTAQLDGPTAVDTFYVHNEVFRDFVTTANNPYGQTLDSAFIAGRVIRNVYSYTISPANAGVWKPSHMNVIAFVQQPDTKVIYQGKEIKLTN
jgi:hypothetical protein